MTAELNRDEFTAGYLVEADEHVRSAVSNLLAVENALRTNAPQHRAVRELFRSLHTLKGLSAMVGIDPIVDLAHEMETILRDADRSTGKLSAPAVELLLKGVRAIEQRVGAFAKKQPIAAAPRKLLEALADFQRGSQPAPAESSGIIALDPEVLAKLQPVEHDHLATSVAAGKRALRIDFYPSPARSDAGFSITTVREKLSAIGEIVRVIPRAVPKSDAAPGGLAFVLLVLSEASEAELANASSTDASTFLPITLQSEPSAASPEPEELDDEPEEFTPASKSVIRVDVARLDDALDKLSALVVTRFKLTHAVQRLRDQDVDVRELNAILSENYRQLRDLRAAITKARMVSVGELLERVPLLVRSMNRATGKQVKLVIDAGNAELDKAVAERIFPAIVHLIRNAVDHAIETPAERTQLGKSIEGTITVSCHEHSDTVLEICVSDDGHGIDGAALARRSSRPVPRDGAGLLELITLPGLSTLDDATSSSGRGMGMDIVRRIVVDVLRGDLSLRTQPGLGSSFTMRLPMSISILDSFSFVCGAQAFAVPVSIVDEIVDLESESLVQTPAPKHSEAARADLRLLERRGEAIPLFGLASLLQLTPPPDQRGKAFIIRPQGQAFAFAIDRVLGQQEIVVRPIEDPLVKVAGVAGTTDLGDGRPTLVLDLIGLSTLAVATSTQQRKSA
jgi:two-component system chemotaxis sensor kinase CheA